jgi:hypothetical protein
MILKRKVNRSKLTAKTKAAKSLLYLDTHTHNLLAKVEDDE